MDYNTDEQEIDLKDLMFAVFHKWRPVILVAVICGLLLGGVKGYMTYKSQSDPEVRSFMRRIKRHMRERSRI